MTDEQTVKAAQIDARQATFKTMFPILTDIRANAFNFVKKFVETRNVPYYNVNSYKVYDYIEEPQMDYNFDFVISGNLSFCINSYIRLNKDEDVVYMTSVRLDLNGKYSELGGCIMVHTGNIDSYKESIEFACDLCFKKYLELHEHFKDTFF